MIHSEIKSSIRTKSRHQTLMTMACVFLFACQKENKQILTENTLGASAKEWYYSSFKKSAEWKNSPLHGKKLPDWKHAIYKKAGGLEIVEFPLVTMEKNIPVPTAGLSAAEQKRIAEASLSRIVFLKRQNQPFMVRELNYIPAWDYLQKNGMDISKASFAEKQNDFTGRVIVKTWDGREKARWKIAEGGGRKKLVVLNPNATTVNRTECPSVTVCTYTQNCTEYYGTTDNFLGESCDDWQLENCEQEVPEQPCDDEEDDHLDPCPGMSEEECNCQFYGMGCGLGGASDPDDQCANFECPSSFSSVAAAEDLSATVGTATIQNGVETRTDIYNWVINNSTISLFGGGWNWKFTSTESAEAVKTGGVWKYVSISHGSVTRSGNLPGCLDSDCTVNGWTPSVLDGGDKVKMTLNFTVRVNITCCKVCSVPSETMSAYNSWTCPQ